MSMMPPSERGWLSIHCSWDEQTIVLEKDICHSLYQLQDFKNVITQAAFAQSNGFINTTVLDQLVNKPTFDATNLRKINLTVDANSRSFENLATLWHLFKVNCPTFFSHLQQMNREEMHGIMHLAHCYAPQQSEFIQLLNKHAQLVWRSLDKRSKCMPTRADEAVRISQTMQQAQSIVRQHNQPISNPQIITPMLKSTADTLLQAHKRGYAQLSSVPDGRHNKRARIAEQACIDLTQADDGQVSHVEIKPTQSAHTGTRFMLRPCLIYSNQQKETMSLEGPRLALMLKYDPGFLKYYKNALQAAQDNNHDPIYCCLQKIDLQIFDLLLRVLAIFHVSNKQTDIEKSGQEVTKRMSVLLDYITKKFGLDHSCIMMQSLKDFCIEFQISNNVLPLIDTLSEVLRRDRNKKIMQEIIMSDTPVQGALQTTMTNVDPQAMCQTTMHRCETDVLAGEQLPDRQLMTTDSTCSADKESGQKAWIITFGKRSGSCILSAKQVALLRFFSKEFARIYNEKLKNIHEHEHHLFFSSLGASSFKDLLALLEMYYDYRYKQDEGSIARFRKKYRACYRIGDRVPAIRNLCKFLQLDQDFVAMFDAIAMNQPLPGKPL